MNDVAAQDGGLDFGDTDALPLPDVTHARYDMVAPDSTQFLLDDFGSAVGLIGMFGDDGRFGDYNA